MPADEGGGVVEVPVRGGSLVVHRLGPRRAAGAEVLDGSLADPVLALHGITANALSWRSVVAGLGDDVPVLAPDLRGRACSRDVPGPFGLAAHADDAVAVLDAAGVESGVLVGHSMGAFVAALAAARHPGRVRALVLVDGGLGFPAPPGADVDEVLTATIGPAMRRLGMRFTGPQDYLDFWRPHPALGGVLAGEQPQDVEAWLLHDLVPDGEGGHRSSCRLDAVRADGADVVGDPVALAAVRDAGVPTDLLWAPRGLLDEEQGLYDEQRLAALDLPPHVRARAVPGTNHYTVLLDPGGVRAVADAVRAALATG